MSPALVYAFGADDLCYSCGLVIVGARTPGWGITEDGEVVCGFCSSVEDENRMLSAKLAGGDLRGEAGTKDGTDRT